MCEMSAIMLQAQANFATQGQAAHDSQVVHLQRSHSHQCAHFERPPRAHSPPSTGELRHLQRTKGFSLVGPPTAVLLGHVRRQVLQQERLLQGNLVGRLTKVAIMAPGEQHRRTPLLVAAQAPRKLHRAPPLNARILRTCRDQHRGVPVRGALCSAPRRSKRSVRHKFQQETKILCSTGTCGEKDATWRQPYLR